MTAFQKKILFIVAVFLTRLPFLFEGYGVEEDSWGTALAALHTHETGVFETSRFPGHPVQELLLSLLWCDSPFFFNLLTALFSCLGVLFFLKIWEHHRLPYPFLASFVFSLVPVVWISSVYTIDYMWAQAFVMMAWYFVLNDRYLYAALFLGLAVGVRLTSGAAGLCFLFFLPAAAFDRSTVKRALMMGSVSLAVGLLCFIPVFLQYSTNVFVFWDQFAPSAAKLIYKGTIGVWGSLGCVALLAGLIFLIPDRKAVMQKWKENTALLTGLLLMILLFTVVYLRLPQKSAYVLPAVPAVLLLFGFLLREKQLLWVFFLLLPSGLLAGINLSDPLRGSTPVAGVIEATISGQQIFFDPLAGPVFNDLSKRKNKDAFVRKVLSNPPAGKGCFVVSGWWYNQLVMTMREIPAPGLIPVFYATESELKAMADSLPVYFLPEMDAVNDQYFDGNFTRTYSNPYP